MSIAANIARIQYSLPSTVQMVAVTKNRSVSEMAACLQAGIKQLGENRVQEAEKKIPTLEAQGWSFKKILIGPLQRNKVKKAVRLFDEIHSVDRLEIAQKINEEAQKIGKIIPVLLEVNIGKDPNKHGFFEEAVEAALGQLATEKGLHVKGLMTIVPLTENAEKTRSYFKKMKNLFERLKAHPIAGIEMQDLSMGMSQDYHIAVEEGATSVRIGTALFEG